MGRRNQLASPRVAFDPAQIRGLELWLDGADSASLFQDLAGLTPATTVNDPVGCWLDKSGFGRHATQASATARPVVATHASSGKTVLSFDGNNDFLSSGTTDTWRFMHNGTPHYIFVAYSTNTTSICGIIATGTTGVSTGFDLLANTVFFRHGVMNASSGPNVIDNSVAVSSDNGMRILRVRGFASSAPAADRSAMFANGATQYRNNSASGGAATVASTHPLIIGARGGSNIPLAGTIAEVLVFNSMASEADMQRVERYLLRKWGVTAPTLVLSPLDVPNCALWLDASDKSTMYTTDAGAVEPVSSPTEISGCQFWLDASDSNSMFQDAAGTTPAGMGSSVGLWRDKSGNSRHVSQASDTKRPVRSTSAFTNGAVHFDGIDDVLSNQMASEWQWATGGSMTWIFVGRRGDVRATSSDYRYWFGNGEPLYQSNINSFGIFVEDRSANEGRLQFVISQGSAHNRQNVTFDDNSSPDATNWIHAVAYESSAPSLVARGQGAFRTRARTDASIATTAVAPNFGLSVGADSHNSYQGSRFGDIRLAEVCAFNRRLTNLEISRVEKYLANKWGISDVHTPVTTTGQPVGYWADKSGNNNHAIASLSAARPTLTERTYGGGTSLNFNGSTNVMTAEGVASVMNGADRPVTMFCVVKPDSPATNSCVLGWFNTGTVVPQLNLRFDGTNWVLAKRDDSVAIVITASTAQMDRVPQVVSAVVTGTTASIYRNSRSLLLNGGLDVGITTINSFCVGALNSNNLIGVFNGVFAEVIIFNAALTETDRVRIEQYLQTKWGIGISPPATSHPDAANWIRQVYINGGSVSQRTLDAVSSFCRDIDTAGLRQKFYRLNLFCGNDILACRTPLYRGPSVNERHGFDLDVLTIGSGGSGSNVFTNADYTEYGENGGLRGRLQSPTNSNAGPGLRTGILPFLIPAFYGPQQPNGKSFNYSSLHLAAYCFRLRLQTLGAGYFMGSYGGVGPTLEARHGISFAVNQDSWLNGTFAASVSGAYDGVNRGLYLANVRCTNEVVSNSFVNELTLYAGAMRYNTGRISLGPFLNPSTDLSVFGECRESISYSQNDSSLFRSEQTLQGYSIGLGLSEEEVQAYSRIMNRFQSRLGRGIPENTMPSFPAITNLDARDWLARVYSSGGSVSDRTATAVQNFCNAIESFGIRDRFYRLNLFCGNGIESCVVPLYRGPSRTGTQYGGLTDRNINFLGSDYVEYGALGGGIQGNGTSKYLDTGLEGSELAAGNRHVSAYEIIPATTLYSPSVLSGNSTAAMHGLGPWTSTTQYRYRTHNTVSGNPVTNFVSGGFWLGSDDSVSSSTLYLNGSAVASASGSPVGGSGNTTYRILGTPDPNPGEWSEARLGGYSVGLSLAPQQVANLYGAMRAFQASLRRDRPSSEPMFATVTNEDAKLWIDKVYANRGTISVGTAAAVNAFCNAIDNSGIRDRFFRLNLFCGDNLAACLVPLYRGPSFSGTKYGNDTDTNSNFVEEDYVERGSTGGLKGDGINKFLNTGLATNLMAEGNRHIGAYERDKATRAYDVSIGSDQSPGNKNGYWLRTENPFSSYTFAFGNGSSAALLNNYIGGGMMLGVNASVGAGVLYRNGNFVASANLNVATPGSESLYVLALNRGGGASDVSDARLGGYSAGMALNASQVVAYNSAMQTFQTALNRAV